MAPNILLALYFITQFPAFRESMVVEVKGKANDVSIVVSSFFATAFTQIVKDDGNMKSNWTVDAGFIRLDNGKVIGYYGVDVIPCRLVR